jgi:hypothetical protein
MCPLCTITSNHIRLAGSVNGSNRDPLTTGRGTVKYANCIMIFNFGKLKYVIRVCFELADKDDQLLAVCFPPILMTSTRMEIVLSMPVTAIFDSHEICQYIRLELSSDWTSKRFWHISLIFTEGK